MNDASEFPGVKPSGNSTFVVNLKYGDVQNIYLDGTVRPTSVSVDYRRSYSRISPDKGAIAAVKSFVTQFSGCEEAHKLRKRMIAIGRIHKTVSGEEFRFPIGCES
jgi:hypothetical protein